MPIKEGNTFSLNLKTQKVVSFITSEKDKTGESKTSFINELLECLASWPIVLTAHTRSRSILHEIKAVKELLEDDLIKQIPRIAARSRRNPVQMLLYLIERGIDADKQLASTQTQNVYELKASDKHSDRRRSDRGTPSRELSTNIV